MAINKSLAKKIANKDEFHMAEGTAVIRPVDINGVPTGDFRRIGSMSEFSVSHEVEETEIRESESGQSNIAETIYNNPTAVFTLGFRSFSSQNYQIFTLGNTTDEAAAVAETKTINIKADTVYSLDDLVDTSTNAVSIADTSTGLVILEEGKNFEIGESGLIQFYTVAEQTSFGADTIIDDTGVDYDVTYDKYLQEATQAFQNNALNFEVQFAVIKKSGGVYEEFLVIIPNLSVSPSDGVTFLSPTDAAVATVTGKAQQSKINTAASPYLIKKRKAA